MTFNPNHTPGNKQGNEPSLENLASWKGKTFHERLGISPGADEKEIKSAFRKATIKYHPDRVSQIGNKNLVTNYEEVFKLISEAYAFLSDPANAMSSSYSQPESKYSNSRTTTGSQEKQTTYERPSYTYTEPQQEPYNEAREKEEFITFAKKNINYDFQIEDIKKYLDELLKIGFNKEQLLRTVHNLLIMKFTTMAKKHSAYVHQATDIDKYMNELVKLGMDPRQLEPIATQYKNMQR